jgi:hypothetical protein
MNIAFVIASVLRQSKGKPDFDIATDIIQTLFRLGLAVQPIKDDGVQQLPELWQAVCLKELQA